MPSPASVHEQLTDIVVRVVGCRADQVVPSATLTDLGVDSLAAVEIAEELGRRFDRYLSDQTVDGLVTVQDAIDAVVAPAPGAAAAAADTPPTPQKRQRQPGRTRRQLAALRLALWFTLAGVAIGGILGFGGAALVNAAGLDEMTLPPLAGPSTEPTTPAPTRTTQAPPPAAEDTVPEPTFVAEKDRVAPGERFLLSGAFPALGAGAKLQVQVKDDDGPWDDFPIETTTREGGKFRAEIYTSRTGERQFRMLHKASQKASPSATVEIG